MKKIVVVILIALAQVAFGVTFTCTPAAVSNTYSGFVTLQITNIPTGDPVVVQKYLDLNSNGIVDGSDWLVQQFTVTDGTNFIIGGATNLSVPGDLNSATGAITAALNFQGGDFVQNIVGRYLYVISSPLSHFTPITNIFQVTNFPYAQAFTGTVVSNGTSTTLSNAVVLLFPAPRPGNHGPGTPVGGTVAGLSGSYSIAAPPGTYVPAAIRANYVVNYSGSPVLTLGSTTINTNLSLTAATASISGTLVDAANPGLGLPGVFEPAVNNSGLIAIAFTDPNGHFTEGVTAGSWNLGNDDSGLIVQGYVGSQNGVTTNAGSTGVLIPSYKSTAMFYGTVKDNLGIPLTGVDVNAYDNNNNLYQSDGYSDPNGKYAVGIVGGLGGGDPWGVQVSTGDGSGNPVNYIFSQPAFDQNGGTNLAVGQAVKVNFTAILATNIISGNVQENGANIAGVNVYASATISGVSYNVSADTDANGNYAFNVANGTWSVGVNCNGGNSSLDNLLGPGTYLCPNNQNVTINNNNGTAGFTVQPCSGVQIFTTSLPDGSVSSAYDQFLSGSTCSGNLNWSLNDPADFPPGLSLNGNGEISGTPTGGGTYNFSVDLSDGNGSSTNQSLSLFVIGSSGPLQITTTSLPDGVVGGIYSQQLTASGGQPAYNWALTPGSLALPGGLTLSTGGLLSGIPTNAPFGGTNYYFSVRVTDSLAGTADQLFSLAIYPALTVATNALPNGTNGFAYSTQILVSGGNPLLPGGQASYGAYVFSGSLPPGLNLSFALNTSSNEFLVISGTPTNNGTYPFSLNVGDSDGNVVLASYSITIGISPLFISTATLSNATVGIAYTNQLQGAGGTAPYVWTIANGSQPLPPALTLATNGLISGVPAAGGTNSFIVRLTDHNALTVTRALTLITNPKPVLGSPNWLSHQFKMQITGAANQNYTVQVSTNLSAANWTPLLVTNSPTTNSFSVVDPNATNTQRFYRVLIGP